MSESRLKAIVKCKCPRCHKGDLFVEPNPYKIKYLTDMPEKCAYCGQRTQPEPGFYYGAMYMSYGLCVVLSLLDFVLVELILKAPPYYFLFFNAFVLVVLWPYLFRYARVVYIYIFIKYDPKIK
jgi:uncharacterized protein (DUF983 family)